MMFSLLAAWRLILDPMPLPGSMWWFTILPLALGIALSYKAARIPEDDGWWIRYLRASLIMSLQIIALLILLAVGLHLIVEVFAPGVGAQLN